MSEKVPKTIEGRNVSYGAGGESRLIRRPKVTILSLARVALKIVKGRKSLIPPSMLFPEGVTLKLRCSDSPSLFLKFL